jgi:hypothetical protein
MNGHHQNREAGRMIDSFLEDKPRAPDLPISLRGFNYLECTDCHLFIELHQKFVDATAWKFSLMGLRPSILSVAKGVCPTCQDMRKQFKGVLGDQKE